MKKTFAALVAVATVAGALTTTPASAQRGVAAGVAAGLIGGAIVGGAIASSRPAGLEVYRQAYRNWSGEIRADQLWTCAPRTVAEVVSAVNWAHGYGWRIRRYEVCD